MSSILTNQSALVALDTLRGINKSLGSVQAEISTGLKVSNAKDNSAIYAISTVIKTDIDSFKQITDTLNLGSATVGVARSGSEQITNLLQDAKELIVSAQEENVDRTKIQANITELVGSIGSIVSAAQFNGQNLISGGGSINVLSSLDRAADGSVTASRITVDRVDLGTGAETVGSTALATGDGGTVSNSTNITAQAGSPAVAGTGTITIAAGALVAGTNSQIAVGGETISYTSREGDTINDVANAFKTQLDALVTAGTLTGLTTAVAPGADPEANNAVLTITNTETSIVTLASAAATKGGAAAGGLVELNNIDVTTTEGATAALAQVETLLQASIDAAAQFGSKQTRIENQGEFVKTLTDALTVGVGALVDSDLEEASARLQSLQVQQQLGVQSLSIANQGPQQLLALFR